MAELLHRGVLSAKQRRLAYKMDLFLGSQLRLVGGQVLTKLGILT